MKELIEIAETIESLAIAKFGSVNKMLKENDLSVSVIANMKRQLPSIPNIKTFCKIAECLDVSIDYLLDTNYSSKKKEDLARIVIKEKELSVDEDTLLDLYRNTDTEGQKKIQKTVRDIWVENQRPKSKSSDSQSSNDLAAANETA